MYIQRQRDFINGRGRREDDTTTYETVRKANCTLDELPATNLTRLIPVQTPERMNLIESIPQPLRSFHRFLAGRISTTLLKQIYSTWVYIHVRVCVCVRARVYIYIYRLGTNLQVKLLSRSVSTVRFKRVYPSRTTRSVYTPGI